MPSVAMNGGIFIFEMMMPLTKPANDPVTIPASTPTQIGSPMFVTTTPVMTAANVITVPTERSIPPVMMMKVTPNAKMPLTAVASKMPMTFVKGKEVRRCQREDDEQTRSARERQQFLRSIRAK